MSRAEGYVLDLYCDNVAAHDRNGKHSEFTGSTRASAYRAAHKRGWKTLSGSPYDLCPKCARSATPTEKP